MDQSTRDVLNHMGEMPQTTREVVENIYSNEKERGSKALKFVLKC